MTDKPSPISDELETGQEELDVWRYSQGILGKFSRDIMRLRGRLDLAEAALQTERDKVARLISEWERISKLPLDTENDASRNYRSNRIIRHARKLIAEHHDQLARKALKEEQP